MFTKIQTTNTPPREKPLLIWDGKCGFCKYWYLFLKSLIGEKMEYQPYQDVHARFDEIPLKEFKKASRVIDTDGNIYSGPDSLYKSMEYLDNPQNTWHRAYQNSRLFRKISDKGYDWVSKHRPQLYRLSIMLLGKNPAKPKHRWLLGLAIPVTLTAFLIWRKKQ